MKSGKQRRLEIKEKRRNKAQMNAEIDVSNILNMPKGALKADHSQLAHNNTYGLLPQFYIDKVYKCRDCGSDEIWTAKQQKWWYEMAKGHIDSTAVRCRRCRKKIREAKEKQKMHMAEMAERVPHPNEAFFKKN
jgi:DNA-directed RNA polymerase subunit RPC12/RpoP